MSAFVINPYSFVSEDADAKAYLDAVESADGQALEAAVRKAVDDFVKGCKADGIWSAIKASCILAGARTLTGALTPLVGSAPTNVGGNFVSGDYDRKDGLLGNGSSKYLDSNYALTSSLQNNRHLATYVSAVQATGNHAYMGAEILGSGGATNSQIIVLAADTSKLATRLSNTTSTTSATNNNAVGLVGANRAASGSYTVRGNGANSTVSQTSGANNEANMFVFARNVTLSIFHTSARLSFYSIGESLALADLDTRVSTLISDIDNAI